MDQREPSRWKDDELPDSNSPEKPRTRSQPTADVPPPTVKAKIAGSAKSSKHGRTEQSGTPVKSPSTPQPSLPSRSPAAKSSESPLVQTSVATKAASGGPEPELAFHPQEYDIDEHTSEELGRHRLLFTAVPSWLVSLFAHLALILILAFISLDPVNRALNILQASTGQQSESLEEFELQSPSLDADTQPLEEPLSPPTPMVTESVQIPEVAPTSVTEIETAFEPPTLDSITESIMPSSAMQSVAMAQMASALNSRSSAMRSELLERYGGNAETEKAVAMALKWIADHQARNGGWTFQHNVICRNQCDHGGELANATNAATAMAILPFLGAGQTHIEGQYKDTVKRGLAFLINKMEVERANPPRGSWHEPGGTMYSHGLASITICEAYAMTGDPDLVQPAQLALNYLIYAQHERGGWRYEPKQPGDTSVVGWCLMALKSGRMGKLSVPTLTFERANRFLDFVGTNQGAYYGYDKPTSKIQGRLATTAVGLLCRMYLGWPKEAEGIQQGVQLLDEKGPRLKDLYYSYYATQVMRHYGGPQWERWNVQMRDLLLESQVQAGHAAGSWAEAGGRHAKKGGRLYETSLATMILEVYYRHMPLYSERSSEDDFEI